MTKPLRLTLIVLAAVVAAGVVTIGGLAAFLTVSGTPLVDEWQCARGEAPVVHAGGGSCAEKGAALPDDARWHPLGNRPLTCEDRWGWVEVVRTGARPGADTDCFPDDKGIPEGWERAATD